MLRIDSESISVVKFRDAKKPYIAMRRKGKEIYIYSPPNGAGLYPHSVTFDPKEDIYKEVEEVSCLSRINIDTIEDVTDTIPEGTGFFYMIIKDRLRVGYRIYREYKDVLIATAQVATIDYTKYLFEDSIVQIHIDDLKECKFAPLKMYPESVYNAENERILDLRHWSADFDTKYDGPVFASDMIKEIFLIVDKLESISYTKNVDTGMESIFGYRRLVGEASDNDLSDWYGQRRKAAGKNMWFNNFLRRDALAYLEEIGYKRELILSPRGLDYLRNLWLTSDRYINDLGL
jgi:hypothetical protein